MLNAYLWSFLCQPLSISFISPTFISSYLFLPFGDQTYSIDHLSCLRQIKYSCHMSIRIDEFHSLILQSHKLPLTFYIQGTHHTRTLLSFHTSFFSHGSYSENECLSLLNHNESIMLLNSCSEAYHLDRINDQRFAHHNLHMLHRFHIR